MNRREFSALLPLLVATPALTPRVEAQAAPAVPPVHTQAQLPILTSGLYPGDVVPDPKAVHVMHHYILGMLPDNIRLEAHGSILAPGAPHEKVGHHKHTEVWFLREGKATLMTAGVEHELKPGDMGVCIAGDEHWIGNASSTDPVSYFVLTVGPPE
jgi:mannose-6-phosphate isomerase-like protein (cupin superfamily)